MGYERLSAMPFIFKRHSFGFAGFHRRWRVDTLQSLNTGFLVGTHHMHPWLMPFFGLRIELADRSDVLTKNRFICHVMVEPIGYPVWLEIRLSLNHDRRLRSKGFPPFPV
jgi:hypothetical protein